MRSRLMRVMLAMAALMSVVAGGRAMSDQHATLLASASRGTATPGGDDRWCC